MKDYYQILGVDKKSSTDEIKKAYRKLSKQYHPDVNPEGEEKFKEIAEAYDILGDDNKRKSYDMGGMDMSGFGMSGQIARVNFYDKALSDKEIFKTYVNYRSRFGL